MKEYEAILEIINQCPQNKDRDVFVNSKSLYRTAKAIRNKLGTSNKYLPSEMEAAIKFDVGAATIRAWVGMNMLPSIKIGDVIYIPANAEKPNQVIN